MGGRVNNLLHSHLPSLLNKRMSSTKMVCVHIYALKDSKSTLLQLITCDTTSESGPQIPFPCISNRDSSNSLASGSIQLTLTSSTYIDFHRRWQRPSPFPRFSSWHYYHASGEMSRASNHRDAHLNAGHAISVPNFVCPTRRLIVRSQREWRRVFCCWSDI